MYLKQDHIKSYIQYNLFCPALYIANAKCIYDNLWRKYLNGFKHSKQQQTLIIGLSVLVPNFYMGQKGSTVKLDATSFSFGNQGYCVLDFIFKEKKIK